MEKQTQKKSRKPIIILSVVFVILAGFGAFYWIRSAAYETTDDAQLDGNIYSVRAGVTAYLDKIAFQDNQRVEEGDTLFIFDTVALDAKVQQAKAALENAKKGLSVSDMQALASRQQARASLQTALSGTESIAAAKASLEKAEDNFNRDIALLKIKAVTQVQYEADKAALAQDRAGYEQAMHEQQSSAIASEGLKSKAKAAHHQIAAAASVIAEREAELRQAEEQLEHAYVLAPCTGIVTKRSVDQGQYVLAGQSLCAVVDEQHLWVTANFKETQLHKIKPGQPVNVTLDAYPGLELKGEVASYGGATGAKFSLIPPDNASGNFIKVTQRFPLRIRILPSKGDPDSLSDSGQDVPVLFPGLSAFVKVNTK
jgi:membrane fusion protein (multidrug efflux system)